MAKLFKSHITQLRKVYSAIYSRTTLHGTQLILGGEGNQRADDALSLISEAIIILEKIS